MTRLLQIVKGLTALTRGRSPLEILRGGAAALRIMGPLAFMRRAAEAATERDDDERYRRWLASAAAGAGSIAGTPDAGPLVSILVPVFNTEPRWLERCIASVRDQTYARWELILSDDGSTNAGTLEVLRSTASDSRVRVIHARVNGGIVAASNAALAQARGEFVGFLDHDDELGSGALAAVIAAAPDLDVIYTDEDKIDAAGLRRQPHFKPDWSPELLDSCMYVSHFTAMRRQLAVEAGGFRAGFDGSQDYDLMLRVTERTGRVAHVPRVLYGWRMAPGSAASSQLAKPWAVRAGQRALEEAIARRGREATVTSAGAAGHYRVRYRIAGAPIVSVLVPSGPEGRAAQTLGRTTAGRILEIVAADPPSADRPLAAWFNVLARRATGAHLLFLHQDVEPCAAGWLDALLEFSQQAPIGAVGPFLLRRDRTIDSAGLVLGAGGVAGGALQGAPEWTRGHVSNALDVRNCSAVSGACLLTRRDVFERLGGFDDRFESALFAVDYGLRLRDAGLRVVVTPHARMWHDADCPHRASPEEAERLRARWGTALDRDPYYNAAFDRRGATFRLPPDEGSLVE